MPVGFIGHGSPLAAIDEAKGSPWRAWGGSLRRPRAILAVSAHWEDTPVTIGRTADHTQLFYDFYGFPGFMYELQYPAPGAPALADRVEALLAPHLSVARSERALDHGVWVPLLHMFPEAEVPVLEISMPMTMSEEELVSLGAELSPLRDEGVFILATGNVVHNLFTITWKGNDPPSYAVAFDKWVAKSVQSKDDLALQGWLEEAPDPLRNHPSAEHYRPLLVAAGAARRDDAVFPVQGFEHSTISRRSVQLG